MVEEEETDLRRATRFPRSFGFNLTISLCLLVSLRLVEFDEAFGILGIVLCAL